MENENVLEAIKQAILSADAEGVKAAIAAALDAGVEPTDILSLGITGAMQAVGEKWNAKEFWLPDVMAAADTVKQGIDFLKPRMALGQAGSTGTVVIGTVKGDIHSVGKNLVATFLGASGFEVYDLGEDIPAEKFIEAVEEHDADIVAMSCFSTNVTPVMIEINDQLKEKGLRDKVFTMIGGVAMAPNWAARVGADAFAGDAHEASETARAHMAQKVAAG
ncbi:MAG: cobalamin-dependent protein [Coriobacteriales bacterium]|jgi:corrinoid protein of di/trimethylamine methyltransferase|nr:cobalamin-dependent protein [Coriobacteriales bacterium]